LKEKWTKAIEIPNSGAGNAFWGYRIQKHYPSGPKNLGLKRKKQKIILHKDKEHKRKQFKT